MAQLNPIDNKGLEYVNDLAVTRASVTTVGIAAGQCRDSTNTNDMVLSAAVTVDCATNGANGLDSGSLANTTWYYVHLIGDSRNENTPKGLVSTSATAPTLPSGYDMFRRLGCMRTNGSAQFLDVQIFGNGNDREYFWNVEVAVAAVLAAGAETSYTAQSLATLVAPTSQIVKLKAHYTPQTAGQKFFLRPTGSGLTELVSYPASVASQPNGFEVNMQTNASQSIDYHVTGTGALSLWVLGFKDFI